MALPISWSRDGSAWEMGTLGKMEAVPGWPGEDVYPPQPMVAQIRAVLERYRAAGGRVEMEMFEGSGHGPHIDAAERWSALFFSASWPRSSSVGHASRVVVGRSSDRRGV